MTLFMRDEQMRAEGRKEGRKEGRSKERISAIRRLVEKNQSLEFILELGYTEDEYNQARELAEVK